MKLAYLPYANVFDLQEAIESLACPASGYETSEKQVLIQTCLMRKPLLLKKLFQSEVAILKNNNQASVCHLRESRNSILEELKIIQKYEQSTLYRMPI